jgi:hypothetical protein
MDQIQKFNAGRSALLELPDLCQGDHDPGQLGNWLFPSCAKGAIIWLGRNVRGRTRCLT